MCGHDVGRKRLDSVTADDVVFRALADGTRRGILHLVKDRRLSVGDIAKCFELSRPAISKHLRVLRDAGLVSAESRGRVNAYTFDGRPLHVVWSWLIQDSASSLTTRRRRLRISRERPDRHGAFAAATRLR